ncbi:methylated-DNA--[protein]-cysteine S-methyltransferase [Aliiroseovarius sp. PTFE2010]|uniref:methylated-DNA--[protein]-cysteine S-methyltransferase n=1 Tax=Aliiroseovarius sp. PTFE2010 TaxID=3417190 RepID=UPI003CE68A1A
MTQSAPDTIDQAYHYGVIKRAIDRIDAHPGGPLPLDALAAELGLSPAHFQRVFTRWAGVSPKRLHQYLTLGHAKALLDQNATTLEATHETGLSSTSRLQDLFVRWEAMRPGDYAKGGGGLLIAHGWFDTPFGRALAMGTDRGLCGLGFSDEAGDLATFDDLRARWPAAQFTESPERIAPWVHAAFEGGNAHLHLIGAPFQIKVWEALLSIPSGQVTTYGDIAQAIGNPRAVRAVGTAVGRNPVSWLIPCHRALRKSGGLGGYHWGLGVKRAMLAYEAARRDAG